MQNNIKGKHNLIRIIVDMELKLRKTCARLNLKLGNKTNRLKLENQVTLWFTHLKEKDDNSFAKL